MFKKLFSLLLVLGLVFTPISTRAQQTHVITGASLPGNCTMGDIYVKTGASAGFYRCSATDTWTKVADVLDTINVFASSTSANLATLLSDETGTGVVVFSTSPLFSTAVVVNGTYNYCADGGANDTYACNLSPALTSYTTGAIYTFKANTANTGAATINFNGLGAKTIVKAAGGITTALADNDIRSGQVLIVQYDGTNMLLQSLLGNAPAGGGGSVSFYQTLGSQTDTGAAVTVSSSKGIYYCDATSNNVTYNLPAVAGSTDYLFTVVKTDATSHSCILDGNGAETINGTATFTIVGQWASETIHTTGSTGWKTIMGSGPLVTDPNVASAAARWNDTTNSLEFTGGIDIATGKFLTINNIITLAAGADSQTFTLPTATDTIMGRASTDTKTNLTLDCVAGSGNHCTFSFYPLWVAGVNQAGTASIGTSLPSSNAATAHPVAGSNSIFGTAQYTATGQSIQGLYILPPDWVSGQTMVYFVSWFGETTSAGNATWTLSTSCVAVAATMDPSWTDTTITDAAGTANQYNTATGNIIMQSSPACGAGGLFFWKLTFTTQPTTSGNQNIIALMLGMTRKPQ